jgi:hypothetical protein
MKAFGGVGIYIHVFLISALVGVVSFRPQPLYPPGKSSRYPLDRRLVGPRDGLDDADKILHSTGTHTPTPWSSSP